MRRAINSQYTRKLQKRVGVLENTVHRIEAQVERLEGTLAHVLVKCSDYDGYDTVDGLKKLIDDLVIIIANLETLNPNELKLRDNIQLMAVRKLNSKIIRTNAELNARNNNLKSALFCYGSCWSSCEGDGLKGSCTCGFEQAAEQGFAAQPQEEASDEHDG